jgi:predicted transcriptional regulator
LLKKVNPLAIATVKISEILELAQARIVAGNNEADKNIHKAFSSDLMSDVLTLDEENILLITGLANLQLVRTAEMADIHAVLLARGKSASPEMVQLADENGLILMETPFSIYKTSGILYSNGLKEVY